MDPATALLITDNITTTINSLKETLNNSASLGLTSIVIALGSLAIALLTRWQSTTADEKEDKLQRVGKIVPVVTILIYFIAVTIFALVRNTSESTQIIPFVLFAVLIVTALAFVWGIWLIFTPATKKIGLRNNISAQNRSREFPPAESIKISDRPSEPREESTLKTMLIYTGIAVAAAFLLHHLIKKK